ncbi:MAG TPA: polyketide cyclase / dehydrase and lipid transport [Amycolatopsis sp.]|nr:polyketide cyclase / dehydrase and lipid transport [Amycolatopsis sp.]
MSIPHGTPPALDIVDETFLTVPPKLVAGVFAEPAAWRRYWPDLVLEVYTDRGDKGLRWTVRGALVGTMEVWLEPVLDGTMLHYFLRASPVTPLRPRELRREFDRRARAAKRIAFGLKELLEDGREPGVPPVNGSAGAAPAIARPADQAQ